MAVAKQIARRNRSIRTGQEKTWTLAFFASVFFIFIEYVRPQEKYAILQGIPLGQLAWVFVLLGALISKTGITLRSTPLRWTAALILWVLLTVLFSRSPSTGFDAFVETMKVVAVYFFIVSAVRTRKQLYIFVITILAVYFLHTNFSLRNWALSGFVGVPAGAYVGSGFFQNPNDFGAALSSFWGISLLLSTIDTGTIKNRIPIKWLYIVSTALFLVGVLTSSSRGTAVAVATAAMFYILVYTKGARQKLVWIALAALGALSFVLLLSEGQAMRFDGMGGETDATAQDRYRTWRVAWQVATDYPFTGVGIGQFFETGLQYAQGEIIFAPHNIFLQILVYSGFPGLLLLLVLIASFFRTQKRSLRQLRTREDRDLLLESIVIGTSVSMFSFLINGQFITVLFYPFMWVLIAIAAICDNLARQHQNTSAVSRMTVRGQRHA